jgi:endonuclease/exonuclease/phosphatase family metal-dependent hydrolase
MIPRGIAPEKGRLLFTFLRKTLVLMPPLLVPLLLAACIGCGMEPSAKGGITVMSYNLQTLFDPIDQGGEYAEYSVRNGEWDRALYGKRLEALASAILAAAVPDGPDARHGKGPDIIVVQEAENETVLRDLAKAVGEYPYIVVSPHEDATLACGVLSRFPPTAAKAHRVRPPDSGPSSVPRHILEVELDIDGRRLVVVAAHLKSKLGGAAETEPERRAAADFIRMLVGTRLRVEPSLAVVVAGDFNENPDEFIRVGGAYPTAMMAPDALVGARLNIAADAAQACIDPLVLYCPWEDAGGYSYRYQETDERIDQLLLSPALVSGGDCPFTFTAFSSTPPEFLVDACGTPIRWSQENARGYSDHLPIRVHLAFSP